MPETPTVTPASKVSFTIEDALSIANSLAALTGAVNLATPGAVALITGTLTLLRETVFPAIKNFQAHELSVLEQAVLAAESAAERARVGAAPATVN